MIPFYGCGVGLAAAVMSRIFAIIKERRTPLKLPLPKIIWKGNTNEIEAFRKRVKMAA